jgi:ATP-binding cassette subfamily B protein
MSDQDDEAGGAKKRVLSNRKVLAFVIRQWMRRPRMLAGSIVLTLIAVAADLMLPWASGALVGAVARGPEAIDAAWWAWASFVTVYLFFFLTRNAAFRLWSVFAARNMEDLTNEAFARVQAFSSDWHADTFAGSTVRKVTRAMWGYDSVSDALVIWLGPAILVLLGLTVSMLLRWPEVGMFTAFALTTFIALNLVLSSRWVRPVNLISNARDSEIGATLADAIAGNAAIKSFGAEERELARFSRTTRAWREASVRTWLRWTTATLIQNLVLVAFQAGLTGLLVWLWSQGRANAGDVAFAITAFLLMAGYLRNFGENVRALQKGLDDVEDVARYLATEPQVSDRPGAPDFRPGLGEIVLDRVTFGYRKQGRKLYDGFSLRIAPGERVALVGPTGAGKSTFVKLIQRLYDLDGGRILLDGQDIAGVTQTSLRRAIAVVPQDPALFHRTIAENIAYGRPDATREEIALAARRARAHDFIARLPDGYDTLVGERGVKLSGGERQRVAIARAFLADAPILVLDEATSSLDVETERRVQAAIEELMEGRTTIVIAHRLSTIRGADRILVFQDGRVVEEGRHGELLAQGGTYARLTAVAEGAA